MLVSHIQQRISILLSLFHFFTHTIFFPFFLFLDHAACGILVPQLGVEPMPPALKAQSLNQWTTDKVVTSSN